MPYRVTNTWEKIDPAAVFYEFPKASQDELTKLESDFNVKNCSVTVTETEKVIQREFTDENSFQAWRDAVLENVILKEAHTLRDAHNSAAKIIFTSVKETV